MVLEEHEDENMTMYFWVNPFYKLYAGKCDLDPKTRKHEIYCTDSHDRALRV